MDREDPFKEGTFSELKIDFLKKKTTRAGKSEGVGDIGNLILIVKNNHIKNIFLRKFLKFLPPKSNLER